MSKYKLDKLAQIVENSNYIMTQEEVCERLNQQNERIAELEEQLKNAIVLPIKNNKLYYIFPKSKQIIEYDVCKIGVDSFRTNDYDSWLMSDCGSDWFLTKEEAEAKLRELKGK